MLRRLDLICLLSAAMLAGAALAQPGGGVVLARSGAYAYTAADFGAVLAVYEAVLEHPLDGADRARLQAIGVAEFNAKPQQIAQGLPQVRALAQAMRSGPPPRQAALRELVWTRLLQQAGSDQFVAATLEVMRRNARIVAEGHDMVVTQPELDALFAAEGDVGRLAGVPGPDAAARATIQDQIGARFGQLPPAEQDQYAHAEVRRALLQARLAATPAARAKLAIDVRQAVHGPQDLPRETRALEDRAVQLQIADNREHSNLTPAEKAQLAAFNQRAWAQTLAIMGFNGGSAVLQAQDQAVTQFNSRTYTAPHNER